MLQLGLLLTVPILCYLAVEHGIAHSISKFIETFVTGSPFFFMFHMGTKAHYYDGTLKYGGAKYRPTGRGFVLQHEDFAELYRFHAGSHLYNGFELLWGLLLLLTLGAWPRGYATYWRTCWSLWAVMVSWLFAPFWFNPLAFDPAKVRQDVKRWLLWMRRKDASPNTSWEAWYEDEHSYLQTGSWLKKLHVFSPGVRRSPSSASSAPSPSASSARASSSASRISARSSAASSASSASSSSCAASCGRRTSRSVSARPSSPSAPSSPSRSSSRWSRSTRYSRLRRVRYFVAAVARVLMFGQPRACILVFQVYDYLCGGLLLGLCCVLSVPQFCRQLQTKSLLSAVFERRVAHNDIMRLIGSES